MYISFPEYPLFTFVAEASIFLTYFSFSVSGFRGVSVMSAVLTETGTGLILADMSSLIDSSEVEAVTRFVWTVGTGTGVWEVTESFEIEISQDAFLTH